MFVRIDHVMICVPDLARGLEQYRRMGFNMHPGGMHTGKGTHNAIAFNQDDYIELLAIRDQDEHRVEAARPGSTHAGLKDYIAAGGGIRYVILQSDDLTADVSAMRARGVDVSEVFDAGRRTPAGQELRWRAAALGPRNPLPIFFYSASDPDRGAAQTSAGRRSSERCIRDRTRLHRHGGRRFGRGPIRQCAGRTATALDARHRDHGKHGGIPARR
jgi:Glyoxalase-like domain